MQSRQTRIRSSDGHLVFIRTWQPPTVSANPIRGVVHISHGMAEHSARYEAVAQALVEEGFVVVAHDHRGHGKSVNHGTEGHYADEGGWDRVVSDLSVVDQQIRKEFPHAPITLLGHSMGSFIVMQYLIRFQPDVSALIMSGSNYAPPFKYAVAERIAKLESLRQGKHGKSALLRQLTFGSFNDRFKPTETDYDWLSRSSETVQGYIRDPLCGFDCTNQLWIDFLGGLQEISQDRNLKKISSTLPIFIFGGTEDPVGQHGKGLAKLAEKLRHTGHSDVELKIYPQGRHEMLNETNRDEVIRDLLHWLRKQDKVLQETVDVRTA